MLSKNRSSKGYLTWPWFLYLQSGHDGDEYHAEVSRPVDLLDIYPNEARQDVVGFPSHVPFYSLLKKVGFSF